MIHLKPLVNGTGDAVAPEVTPVENTSTSTAQPAATPQVDLYFGFTTGQLVRRRYCSSNCVLAAIANLITKYRNQPGRDGYKKSLNKVIDLIGDACPPLEVKTPV